MAEKGVCEESRREEDKSRDLEEETQQVTDSSQGRVVTSAGKLRPVTVLSTESGYNEETCDSEQPLQAITEMKEKFRNLFGTLEEEVTQMLVRVYNEGKEEGRRETLEEVEQERLAYMQHTLTNHIPVACGEASTNSGCHLGPNTPQCKSGICRQSVNITRQSSGESILSPKEEAAGRRQPGTESSVEPVSPTSSCSGETLFGSADERMASRLNITSIARQGNFQSSSDEERRHKANSTGLELHPRKMLASKRKKGKK